MVHVGVAAIELPAGTVEYEDTGGDGPVIVLLHGLLMDSSLWAGVLAELSADFRCVATTLPMGAHRQGMHPDADLSLPGMASLVAEFLDRLDLHDVTLVGNDTGGALVQLLARDASPRIGRIVLASCEAFDNFPARVTGKTLAMIGKLPPALFGLFMQQMRLRPVRRLPVAFGWLTKRGDVITARWMKPVLQQDEIRREPGPGRGAAARTQQGSALSATTRPDRTSSSAMLHTTLGRPGGWQGGCGSDAARLRATAGPVGRDRSGSAELRAPGAGRVGQRGQGHAARARLSARRAPAGCAAGRDRRQLHPSAAGPARAVRRGDPGLRASISRRRPPVRGGTPRRLFLKYLAPTPATDLRSVPDRSLVSHSRTGTRPLGRREASSLSMIW